MHPSRSPLFFWLVASAFALTPWSVSAASVDLASVTLQDRAEVAGIRMSQLFSDHKTLKAGDSFVIDWIPGTGTVLTVKGEVQGDPFKEPAFFNALMRIWLGPKPADWRLKDGLLGLDTSGQRNR